MFYLTRFSSPKEVQPQKIKSMISDHKPITGTIEDILASVTKYAGSPSDLIIHRFTTGSGLVMAAVYLESLADSSLLGSQVIEPINKFIREKSETLTAATVELLISASVIDVFTDFHDALDGLLAGQALLILPNEDKIFGVSLPGYPRRPIEESVTEKSVRGNREGFTEDITDNLSLIRRWIKDPNLRVESKIIGERTKTKVVILYLFDVANPDTVVEVNKRLEKISIDGIIDSGYISEMITDQRLTFFPLVQETERPDKVAASILEGRIAIIVDKSPFTLLVPATSNEFYQTPEDFYFNYWIGTFLRLIRFIGTSLAVTLPALYTALISVNPELLPSFLIQVVASGRTQVPYPAVIEVFLTMLVFEIFREASVRLPANINLIIGIGGGIVLGQAAINSGIIAGTTIMVVIFTSLASFSTANPSKEQAWRLVRYFLFFASGAFGILGLSIAGLIVLAHMAGLKSFGVSYLAPWAPPLPVDMVDGFGRIPWWARKRRPPSYRPQQEDRLGNTKNEGDK
ncbi:spore germination protein [Desulfosporosinus fructosivorans]|uniref:Spore germination protein n=1 Tax=Desulfosporosinus fructosivorans TaxID=2018669 RepID=A0A4Z0R030_9FIRM|nr:spore germination protein [Desulfosporosinus fructosivorans]TGE35675.1 spore germination protein [Desulfosporosinus fructosivorans]